MHTGESATGRWVGCAAPSIHDMGYSTPWSVSAFNASSDRTMFLLTTRGQVVKTWLSEAL